MLNNFAPGSCSDLGIDEKGSVVVEALLALVVILNCGHSAMPLSQRTYKTQQSFLWLEWHV